MRSFNVSWEQFTTYYNRTRHLDKRVRIQYIIGFENYELFFTDIINNVYYSTLLNKSQVTDDVKLWLNPIGDLVVSENFNAVL